MKILDSILQAVGNTPMLRLSRIAHHEHLRPALLAKLEYFNPAGSIKDRIALAMIDDAEKRGMLKPGATIIEPTSGNTGIGLAMVCAARGYHLILTMPDTMSIERQKLVRAYGGKVELTPGASGMKGAIARAQQLKEEIEGSVILSQFDNPANPEMHYRTTAEEILRDCAGSPLDYLVAGVGTGGTISGIGKRIKEVWPEVKIVAVEPQLSPVLSGGNPGPHPIQGIGAGFIPKNYNSEVVDRVMQVSGDEAFRCARLMGTHEGVLVGISSGAALAAAIDIARTEARPTAAIGIIMPDSGERYLSTSLYE